MGISNFKQSTRSTPRSEARGMLRVDTERRFSLDSARDSELVEPLSRFRNRGLPSTRDFGELSRVAQSEGAPSNVSKKENLEKIFASIKELPNQIRQAWNETLEVLIPDDYKKVKNVVFAGMGGSALAAHILQALDILKAPFYFFNDYNLPSYVNSETLFIISSYSGNTEEPLEALNQAFQKGAKILGITSGGKLKDFLRQNQLPAYIFEPKSNLSGQPRMGLGYSLIGLLGLLNKCELLKIPKEELKDCLKILEDGEKKWSLKSKNNEAEKIAKFCKNNIPVFIGSEFLIGNLHTFCNQLNESSKNFSFYFALPELNHHLLEGLIYPQKIKKILKFLFIESDLYYSKTQLRYKLTKEVISKNGFKFSVYKLKAKTKLSQIVELLLLSSFVSFYLAKFNKVDPLGLPCVDYFKLRLAKN